jgi:hypothetical protein
MINKSSNQPVVVVTSEPTIWTRFEERLRNHEK